MTERAGFFFLLDAIVSHLKLTSLLIPRLSSNQIYSIYHSSSAPISMDMVLLAQKTSLTVCTRYPNVCSKPDFSAKRASWGHTIKILFGKFSDFGIHGTICIHSIVACYQLPAPDFKH